jgi:hypothetical protein
VIHGLATLARRLYGDGQLLAHMGLPGEILEPRRTKRCVKLAILFLLIRRDRALSSHRS